MLHLKPISTKTSCHAYENVTRCALRRPFTAFSLQWTFPHNSRIVAPPTSLKLTIPAPTLKITGP
ncbi:hypothetical protein T03_2788 [Trichinella britovi]|uniref:Uncharacterized protein n=1 Tax=Trichinella britovi TaxID=45882 RepID=A0A0V1C8Y0_TRIBR|nr:hypothetical protein T03_2788 [Trichinella britovi]